MEKVSLYAMIGGLIFFLSVIFAILIYLDSIKLKYEIKYIHGWWVIRDVKTQTHIKRFPTEKRAIEWFNENCL